jgi:Ala-tRNA(Pro) deacylase
MEAQHDFVTSDENPETHIKIKTLLDSQAINYSLLVHKPTRTSEESAQVRGVSLASGAKAMLIKLPTNNTSLNFKLIVLSAASKLSWKAIKIVLKTKKAELANESEVKTLTKCLPGAVPPFGSIFGVETLIDTSILRQGDTINFNAGLRTHSISMSVKDYLEIEKGTLKELSETK